MLTVRQVLKEMQVAPSMRAMMTAGEALRESNIAGYNCAFGNVDHIRFFDEMFLILMCGTGVGYSVEKAYVNKLPEIPFDLQDSTTTIVVGDSKGGWQRAFKQLISLLYSGEVPKWDVSKVRPSGARLKTFGGRASGPGPLEDLFHYTVALFNKCAGRRLGTIEAHDLCCRIADTVIVGGVRRSALISLGDYSDSGHASAKSGAFWDAHPERHLANNSAVYTYVPSVSDFLEEAKSLYDSKTGERGIFNRRAAQERASVGGRRDHEHAFGTNPCGEIILRPGQFCNL